jgi:hypothetical protein
MDMILDSPEWMDWKNSEILGLVQAAKRVPTHFSMSVISRIVVQEGEPVHESYHCQATAAPFSNQSEVSCHPEIGGLNTGNPGWHKR